MEDDEQRVQEDGDDHPPAADNEDPLLRRSQLQLLRIQQGEMCQEDNERDPAVDMFSGLVRLPPVLVAAAAPQHATCIALHTGFVGIGTERGLVIVSALDGSPTAIALETDSTKPMRYGPVSALDLSPTASYIVAGHETGSIFLWDLSSKSLIKSIIGTHTNTITSVRFVPGDSFSIVSIDAKGLAVHHTFSKHLLSWSTSRQVLHRGHGQVVTSAVGAVFLAVADFSNLYLYDLGTGRLASHLPLINLCTSLAWGHDGNTLAMGQIGGIVLFQVRDRQHLSQQKYIPLVECFITFVAFLSPSCLGAIVNGRSLIAIDIHTLNIVQSVDVSSVAIATHDRYSYLTTNQSFPSSDHSIRLAPGGSVMMMTGDGSLYQVSMLSPLYRIRVLTDSGRWIASLALALDLYHAAIDPDQKRLVESHLRILAISYIKANVDRPDADIGAMYANVAHFCVAFGKISFLFHEVFRESQKHDVFRPSQKHMRTYLSVVLDAIESSDLVRRVPLSIIEACIQQFAGQARIERCVSVLDPIDIATLRPLCVSNRLWAALFSLCHRANLPMSLPCSDLLSSVPDGDPAEEHVVSQLCRAFEAVGDVAHTRELLNFLLKSDPPCLRRLLIGHCRQLLPAIGSVLVRADIWIVVPSAERPTNPSTSNTRSVLTGLMSNPITTKAKPNEPTSFSLHPDDVVDGLLSAMVNAREQIPCRYGWTIPPSLSPFNDDDLDVLALALAGPLSSGVYLVSPVILRLIMFHLLSGREEDECRLRAIVDRVVLDRGLLPMLLEAARIVEFRTLTVDLFRKSGDHIGCADAFLACRPPDPAVFDYIIEVLNLEKGGSQAFMQHILSRISSLVDIDAARTANLVVEFFTDDNDDVIQSLKRWPELLFAYLRGLLALPNYEASPAIHEMFIGLLAEFEPSRVLSYLYSHHEYSMENVLISCQRFHVVDAIAFLLERTGDTDGALKLLLESLDPLMDSIRQEADQKEERTPRHRKHVNRPRHADLPSFLAAKKTIAALTTLCQRNSQLPENNARWLSILDRIVLLQKCESNAIAQMALVDFIQSVLAAMRGYAPLSSILLKILTEHSDAIYVEFRETILSLIETLAYDADMLRLCNAIMSEDNNMTVSKVCAIMARPITASRSCSICSGALGDIEQNLYMCGHGSHRSCSSNGSCHLCCRPSSLVQPAKSYPPCGALDQPIN